MLSLFFYKNRKIFVLVILLIISVVFMAFSNSESGVSFSIQKVFQTIIYPFEYVISKVWNFFSDIVKSITKIREYRNQLEKTQKQLQKLSKTYQETEELRNQIRVLRKALGLRDQLREIYQQDPVTARVITRDPHNAYHTLIISKGSNAGIKKDMIVVGYYKGKCGIIGRVIQTTHFTAKVMPIHNKASNIGAMISRSRVTGIIEGLGGRNKYLNLSYIPNGIDVRKGDLVVTAPESDVFPQGLVIGHVDQVQEVQGDFHKKIKVKPFIKYNQIEIVFIIKKIPSEYVRRLERAQ